MDLPSVTSLADLAFKAKTNKYYRQLAVISAKYLAGNYYSSVQGRPVTDTVFESSFNYLIRKWKEDGYENCATVCATINDLRCQVLPEPEPRPEPKPEKVESLLKKKMGDKIIAELKKKKTATKKTVRRGVSSSTASRSPVTARRTLTVRRVPATRR
jgi:hypothetical protein